MSINDFIMDNPSYHISSKIGDINDTSDDIFFNIGIEIPYSLKLFYSVQNGINIEEFEVFSHQELLTETINNNNINKIGYEKKLYVGKDSFFSVFYNNNTRLFEVNYSNSENDDYYDNFMFLFNKFYDENNWGLIKEGKSYDDLVKDGLENISFYMFDNEVEYTPDDLDSWFDGNQNTA